MHRTTRRLAILLCLAIVLTAGCAKKKTPAAPADAAPPQQAEPTMQPTPPEPQPQLDPLAGDLASVNEYLRQQGLLGSVYFDFDSAELSAASREQLAKNARFLQEHPELVVAVEGHCDERGTGDYNLALGDRRANAVKSYLSTLGVEGSSLQTISYGEERPECQTSTESCWSRNRRAQFVVVGRRG